jgi:hypothetical protein
VSDPAGTLGGGVSPGMIFAGTYTFESTEPDGDPDTTWGRYYYDNVPGEFSMTVTVGLFTFVAIENDPWNVATEIDAMDNAWYTPRDSYRVFTREAGCPEGLYVEGMDLELITFDHLDAIVGDALLLTPPDLALFESTNMFRIYGKDSPEGVMPYVIRGPVTELRLLTAAAEDSDRGPETWGRTKKAFR